jgi:UDP-3-O-[3-hydroxymyristoyl] N-acetylglucosamine deacetylase / 3-hydroxyacyl-[acyl-carrier-protein] dehydratase
MAEKQRTLSKSAILRGKGLHTGIEVNMSINPAPENSGYQFLRKDIANALPVRAIAENVKLTERSTTLYDKNISVATVEHLLAALYGMGVDNATIELDGPEVPIMDGSALPFVNAILEAGIVDQNAERYYFAIREKVEFKDEENNVEIVAYPDDNFQVDVHIQFNSKVVGNQYATLNNIRNFEKDFSACRTFVFLNEIEFLQKHNLIKGGDLDNAIVISDRHVTNEDMARFSELLGKPVTSNKTEGILNDVDLAFPNEPARHKLLDLMGDLALCGARLKGRIIATRPGHHANVEFSRLLRKQIKHYMHKSSPPVYNPDKEPLFDINQIQKILPHRNPFLLVDKITYMDDWVVCGIKNVTMNETFFAGHFPDEPVMPGVLQIEALAQVGGILLLSSVPVPENFLLYFMRIDSVRFKRKVVPGDTLNIRMELKEPIKRGIALCKGEGFVGDQVAIEAEFMAQLAKKPDIQ